MPIYNAQDYNERYNHKTKHYPLPSDCATSNYPRLIHDKQTWKLLQDVHYEQSEGFSYHHRIHARHRYLWYSGTPDGFIQARDDGDGRGRSLYAIEDIPNRTVFWYTYNGGQANNAEWCTREDMMEFLGLLPHDLQCDVLLWAFAAEEGGCVECNLDEASFTNHGERPELVNSIFDSLGQTITSRDIRKGEELLMDYNSFIMASGVLPWWNELRNTAWKEEDDDETEETKNSARTTTDNGSPNDNQDQDGGDCMDGYVKYGKPKSKTSLLSAVFADAKLIHNAPTTTTSNSDFFVTTLTSLFLALALAREFVTTTTGGRRRRRRR